KRYTQGVVSNDLRIVYDGSKPPGKTKPTSTLLNSLNGSLASLVNGHGCPDDATSCDDTALTAWNDIDSFLQTVRGPRHPTQLDAPAYRDKVKAGQAIFEAARCNACHAGPGFTLSKVFYTPGPGPNGALPYVAP